ncbi:MAG TPA: lipopolysaccharide heptosyltransferase II [Candidatus Krumholzibacterium sp.]|nr:lipopolysaccharide heptosyltransferase II [Candidatus Krumholzibacterium sp.]
MKKGPTGNSIISRSEPEDILILAPNWLGDAVMSLPMIAAAANTWKSASITVGCLDYVAPVFMRSGIGVRTVEWGKEDGLWTRAGKLMQTRPENGWAAVFILPPSFSSALTALLTRSRERIGYATDGRRSLLTRSIRGTQLKDGHLSDSFIRLLKMMPGTGRVEVQEPALYRSERWADTLSREGISGDYFVLAPGATYGTAKMWPRERYSRLAGDLGLQTGWLPVIIGSGAERQVAEDIIAGSPVDGVVVAGKASTGEMIDIIGGARLFIGNDSGPAHISAALGLPTVALFGSTSPEWTAPRGGKVSVLYSGLGCSPCFRRECPLGTLQCLKDISVASVMDAAMKIIET